MVDTEKQALFLFTLTGMLCILLCLCTLQINCSSQCFWLTLLLSLTPFPKRMCVSMCVLVHATYSVMKSALCLQSEDICGH